MEELVEDAQFWMMKGYAKLLAGKDNWRAEALDGCKQNMVKGALTNIEIHDWVESKPS